MKIVYPEKKEGILKDFSSGDVVEIEGNLYLISNYLISNFEHFHTIRCICLSSGVIMDYYELSSAKPVEGEFVVKS